MAQSGPPHELPSDPVVGRATRKDVARLAGVSPTAVSFVMNNRFDQGISATTRARVLAAAAELRYVPHAQARALRRGRNDLVLLLLPQLPASTSLEQVRELLSRRLREANLTSVFAYVSDPLSPLTAIRRDLDPAAVIAFSTLDHADREALDAARIAWTDGIVDPARRPAPLVDQTEIGRMQVEHLAAKGHRRIGVARIDDPLEGPFGLPRARGAIDAAERLGLNRPLVADVDYSLAAASEALTAWRAAGITAVAAHNDLVAMAVLAAVRGAGLRVPQDLSVVGVDDLPMAALSDPALTSIALNPDVPVRRVVDHVRALIGGEEPVHGEEPVLRAVAPSEWLKLHQRATT